ncbi:DUF2335 domain-containing protein [Chitinophaga caseinilytica]|uniref:DUF2335 domain-containing protein n=1 Tax=Chitinophaga caseinilytica TaxID=2267521 RepID=UPI003C2CCA60
MNKPFANMKFSATYPGAHSASSLTHSMVRGFISMMEGFLSFGHRRKFVPRSPDDDKMHMREDWKTVGRYIREAMQQVMSVTPGSTPGNTVWESRSEDRVALPSQFEASVTSAITDILKEEEPAEKKSAAITNLLISISRHHHGPLPDGETVAAYSRFIPDGGNRVMIMAENAQAHRQEMDRTAMQKDCHQSLRGQWMAAVVTVLFLGAAVFIILQGHETAGIAMLGVLATVISIFIYGEWKKKLTGRQ